MTEDDAGGGLRGLRAARSSALVERVEAGYGLGKVDDVVDLGGSSSLNLLVEAGGQRYVVRVYRPYVTRERLDDIQRVRRQLIAGGVPCTAALLTVRERSWIEFDGRLVEVESYVAHDACMDSWAYLESGLPVLGQIHSLLRDTPASPAGKHPAFANYIEPHVLLDRTRLGTERMRGWASSSFALRLADMAEELAYLVSTGGYDQIALLPRQLVHGDYWHNNVLFHKGEIALIMDFDFMGERSRINDLALTLYFTSLKYAERPVSDGQLVRLARLVEAYNGGLAEPLSPVERAALPFVLASQPLWSIGGWVALLDDAALAQQHAEGTVWAVAWALEIVRQLERWQAAFA